MTKLLLNDGAPPTIGVINEEVPILTPFIVEGEAKSAGMIVCPGGVITIELYMRGHQSVSG